MAAHQPGLQHAGQWLEEAAEAVRQTDVVSSVRKAAMLEALRSLRVSLCPATAADCATCERARPCTGAITDVLGA